MRLFLVLLVTFSVSSSFAQYERQEGQSILHGLTQEEMEEIIRNNPMRNMTTEQVRQLVHQNYEGTPMGKLLDSYPRVEDFLVNFLRDETALPGLLLMTKKKV